MNERSQIPAAAFGRRPFTFLQFASFGSHAMTHPRSSVRYMALALAAALLAGCGPAAPPPGDGLTFTGPGWFEDVTNKVGLDFVHDAGPTDGSYFMPQIVGSGAALFDFNNDGLLDILLLQNGGPNSSSKNKLYQQLPGGIFKDVSAGSGLDFTGYNMGVAVGDVNNDGLPDVLITQVGGVRLFLNQGNGKFKDVTKEAGLDVPGWATSAAFLDYDRDGYLDLVVACYVDYDRTWPCGARAARPTTATPRSSRARSASSFTTAAQRPRAAPALKT